MLGPSEGIPETGDTHLPLVGNANLHHLVRVLSNLLYAYSFFSLTNNKQSMEIVFQAKDIASIKALNQEYACSVGKTAWKQYGRSRVSESETV